MQVARAGDVLRDRQDVATRKMSAEELRTSVGRSRCADDDIQTREMTALERDELLGEDAPVRRPSRPRRPTARTQRVRIAMIALRRPSLPKSVTAALASIVIVGVVMALVLR